MRANRAGEFGGVVVGESSMPLKQHRSAQLGPLIAVGVTLSFAWAAFLARVMVGVLGARRET
jgi:hypothetical protein